MRARKAGECGGALFACMKEVGKVTHYYDKAGVAIVELSGTIRVGDKIKIKYRDAEFDETVNSMQIEHDPVEKAEKGQVIGLKVSQKVKEGATVHLVEE